MYDDIDRSLDWTEDSIRRHTGLDQDEVTELLDDLGWRDTSADPDSRYTPPYLIRCSCDEGLRYFSSVADMGRENVFTRGIGCRTDDRPDHDTDLVVGYTETEREELRVRFEHIGHFL